jgi:hypothetical protein
MVERVPGNGVGKGTSISNLKWQGILAGRERTEPQPTSVQGPGDRFAALPDLIYAHAGGDLQVQKGASRESKGDAVKAYKLLADGVKGQLQIMKGKADLRPQRHRQAADKESEEEDQVSHVAHYILVGLNLQAIIHRLTEPATPLGSGLPTAAQLLPVLVQGCR